MVRKLLYEKMDVSSQTILRFRILTTWHSVNSMEDAMKSEALELFNFDDFTLEELASDVRKSGFYPVDKILARMENLYEAKDQVIR